LQICCERVRPPAPVHIYLCGGLAVRSALEVLGPQDFAGPQSELVLSVLAMNHLRPVASADLGEAIWFGRPSPAWRASLRALVSRVRATLATLETGELRGGDGWYQLVLPPGSSVDCLVAIQEAHEAEALLAHERFDDALAHAAVASMIATRPVLPEVAHPWVDALSLKMHGVRVRALDALVQLWIVRGNYVQAISDAEKLLEIDPLHEPAYAGLMRAHLCNGSPAMGLRVYERCRQALAHELGSSPGPPIDSLFQQLLAVT
jgi:DNA-binding SARP family transcriptional activator